MRTRAWRAFRRNRPALVGGGLAGSLRDGQLGADLLSRFIAGLRVSISLGMLVVVVCTLVGVTLGPVSGYVGGWVDTLVQRTADVLLASPHFVLAIALMALFGPGFLNLVIALAFKEWTTSCRIVGSEVLARGEQHLWRQRAPAALGRDGSCSTTSSPTSSGRRSSSPPCAWGSPDGGSVVIPRAGDSAPPASWGTISADGRQYLYSTQGPWISIFPGLAMFLFVLGMNLFGEGLRDALDPRLASERLSD